VVTRRLQAERRTGSVRAAAAVIQHIYTMAGGLLSCQG